MAKRKFPSDYDSEAAYLEDMRKTMILDLDADQDNRVAALDDLRFMIGDQWPEQLRKIREDANKPTLTFNRLVAFVAQLIGNWRLNEVTIKILPDNGGTKQIAAVRENLIRSIQKVSRAEIAYQKAHEGQIICGVGNFRLELDYASDDVFEQDIKIVSIPNALAVVWDRMATDPTGADAEHCFVIDFIPVATYEKNWPKAVVSDVPVDRDLLGDLSANNWYTQDTVRIVAHWRVRSRKRTLALIRTGAVIDITDRQLDDPTEGPPNPDGSPTQVPLSDMIVQRKDGSPVMREADVKYAEMFLCSGTAVLEGPYELPLDRVPVFRAMGWEVNVSEERHRWGLIRFLKDPQRLHNYWRSVIAEKLMLTPKAPWVASDVAVEGREDEWRNAHNSNDSLLIFNSEAANPPQRTPPAQMEAALIQEAGASAQDLRDISNIHEASFGQQSNEVSGKAILARQRVGELGTVIYQDNLVLAIEECGRCTNKLLSFVYDTPRVIKITGPDNKDALQIINDFDNPDSIDITVGKYAVTATTGPSYTTKRVEAAESMLNMVNAMPQIMAVAADKIIEAQDWPGAEAIAARVKSMLPPGTVPADEMTPEQQQNAQAQAAQAAQGAQFAQAKAIAELKGLEAETEEKLARAEQARAQAAKATAEANLTPVKFQNEAHSRRLHDTLDAVDVAHADDNVGAPDTGPDDLDTALKIANVRKANAQADQAETMARKAASETTPVNTGN